MTCVTEPECVHGYSDRHGQYQSNRMDIENISGAATVAVASTIVFVLVAESWQLFSRALGSGSSFSESIMREAAQRFRDEFDRLTRAQSTYLSAALVFAVLFVAAYVLNAGRLFIGFPMWQLSLFLITLLTGLLLAAYQMVMSIAALHQVKLRRDANIAIGHQLQRIAAGFGRVYHDVETSVGIIDHIIVGQSGTYAINVFARRPVKGGEVRLDRNELVFAASKKTLSIVKTAARTAALEREFRRLLDHRVRVRSVIAIPGWQVNEQSDEDHLLVTDKSLSMLCGWKDQADYLMNDDVDSLHQLLTSRCRLQATTR